MEPMSCCCTSRMDSFRNRATDWRMTESFRSWSVRSLTALKFCEPSIRLNIRSWAMDCRSDSIVFAAFFASRFCSRAVVELELGTSFPLLETA